MRWLGGAGFSLYREERRTYLLWPTRYTSFKSRQHIPCTLTIPANGSNVTAFGGDAMMVLRRFGCVIAALAMMTLTSAIAIGQTIVLVGDNVSPEAVAGDYGLNPMHVFTAIKGFAAEIPEPILGRLKKDKRVTSIGPNRTYHLTGTGYLQ